MSTTNTSSTPSRSAHPRQRRPGHVGGQANRNANSTSSPGQAPVIRATTRAPHDADVQAWTPTPLPREYANTLTTLTGWLQELNDPGYQLDADNVIRFFDSLKAAEKSEVLPNIIRHYPQEPALARFVNALTVFLGRLDRDMEHTDKLLRQVLEQTNHADDYADLQELFNDSDNPEGLNLSGLSSGELRTMCLGFAVCANPHAGMPFTGKQFERASKSLQRITDKVLRLVQLAGLPDAGKSISVVLDITNWITRGSKAGLLVTSPTIMALVPRFLDAFLVWAPTPEPGLSGEAAGVQAGRTADDLYQSDKMPHQIGKCAVQIMPIYQNGLIELNQAGVGALRQLALNLCSDALLKQVDKPPIQGVAVINLSNMVKDCIEAGLLSLGESRLPAILKGLLELIGKLPVSEMVKDGGRTLSNASNFLRILIERHLKEPNTLPADARKAFNAACSHAVACSNAAAHLPEQSTTNLLSFMKALDKWIELPELSKRSEWNCLQSGMLDAVGKLVNRAVALGGTRFTAQEALGGLLSALAYFKERRLDMPGTLQGFLRELMDSVAAIKQGEWGRQGRGQVLLAMEVMSDMDVLSIDDIQDALTELLGPCRAPSGVHTLQDLSAAVNRLGPIRDVVVALPPQPATAPAPERALLSPLSADPVAHPPRPGFTAIKAEQAPAMAEQKASTKTKGKRAATSDTTASTATTTTWATATSITATSTGSTSTSSTSTTSAPRSSTRSDANHEVGFELAKRTARSNRNDKPTAMVVTAPVLETRHAEAPTKGSVPVQIAAATQTPKRVPGSSHDSDDSHSESAQGNVKSDKKAKQAGSKKPAKPAVAAAGSDGKAANGKQPVVSAAQKSSSIAAQQKWFDQLTIGGVSLVKLQRMAAANPELLNAKNTAGRTAIFYAVTRGKSDVVDWLMEHKEHRLDGSTKSFLNALFNAVTAGSRDSVEALNTFLDHASKGSYIREPADLEQVCIAWAKKAPWLAPILESAGVNVKPASDAALKSSVPLRSRKHPFHADQLNVAVLMGPNAVREHLAAFPRPSHDILVAGGIALLTALTKGMDAQARILMEHWSGDFIDQALIHTPGNPLNADKSISVDTLKMLIRHKNAKLLKKESIRTNCCLAEAIVLDKLSHATILLDAMDDERLRSSRAGTYNALALAAHKGNELIVSKLLSRSPAMAEEKTDEGKTPLDIARECNRPGIVALLTRHAREPATGKPPGANVGGMPPSQLNLSVLAGPEALLKHLSEFRTRDRKSLEGGGFALLKALQTGRDKEAQILIKHWNGQFIDWMLTNTPVNPLTVAVAKSSIEVVRLLLGYQNGKMLSKEYFRGACCLVEAIRLRRFEHAKILIDAMDDERLALSRVFDCNALAMAASQGHEDIVTLLLDRAPAMAKEITNEGMTPLDFARKGGHVEVVALLTRHAQKSEPATATPIMKVAAFSAAPNKQIDMRLLVISGDAEALRARLAEQKDSNKAMLKDCADSLTLALTFGKTEIATALIAFQAGAVLDDICARPIHPLLIAGNLNRDVLQLLLNHQNGKLLDPDASGNNVLQKAILAGHSESAVVLIKEMDDARLAWANPRGENALTLAVMNGNVEGNEEVARLLFARMPALARQADLDGRTPLDHAILGKHAALIKLLAAH